MGKREYSTKTQRTDLLNKLGFTEAEMQEFWDECIPVNHKIANLSKAGYNWTNLSLWQIGQLPTLKEKTLKEKEKQEKKEKKEKEAAEKKKYYEENFKDIILQKIDSGDDLTETELERLVFDNEIERIIGENDRWTRPIESIIKLCDRYFKICWEEGLTENQTNQFFDQPYEVELDTYKRLIEVRVWYEKGTKIPVRINEFTE